MPIVFTDAEIQELIAEQKLLPADFHQRLHLRGRSNSQHEEVNLEVSSASERRFRIAVRQSVQDLLDFSVILMVLPDQSADWFRLRRYNGKSHTHGNPIEGDKFFDFHIHEATERYQQKGQDEEHYAWPSQKYTTWQQALNCLLEDCNFRLDPGPQPSLFDGDAE